MNLGREDSKQFRWYSPKVGLLQTQKVHDQRVIVGNLFSMTNVNDSQLIKDCTVMENLAF